MWAQWPASAKTDLVNAFNNTVAWYGSGMTSYPGTLVKDPPDVINLPYLKLNGGMPVFDEQSTAWPLYVGHVALSLAAEIYAWVPWSLHNLDGDGMNRVLSFASLFSPCDQYGAVGFCPNVTSTPANATLVFKFFKTNGLIGATKKDTILRLLDWSRRLSHTGGGSFSYEVMQEYFGYYGEPPVSRIIQGTVTTDPATPDDWKINPRHWTAGCFGTSSFMRVIFQDVNIPVFQAAVGGSHLAPWFVSEKLYLSHGDDTYSQMAADAPISMFPISEATYQTWFPANDPATADLNTGRRDYEINLQYPGPYVLNLYCSDNANGKTHATGQVFNNYFAKYYTLAQLESALLWQRLDQRMAGFACAM